MPVNPSITHVITCEFAVIPRTRTTPLPSAKALHLFGFLRIVPISGDLNFLAVLPGPISQFSNRVQQTAPELRQFIFNARGDGGIYRSGYQAVPLQTFQRERKHSLRYSFYTAPQLAKSFLPIAEQGHHEHAPLISNTIQDLAYR